ncbi:hypothetical protein [Lactobacillus apis]|uniref:hypothetical protein n=1 Tax=Lactobacillus apis TaxID=303541 RepID=UPI00243179F5|nr:hypothetical protein [Lactobacillus apis]
MLSSMKAVIKSTAVVLLSVISVGMSQQVSAKENIENKMNFNDYSNSLIINDDFSFTGVNYKIPDDVIEKDLSQQAAAIIADHNKARTPNYVNITFKVVDTKYPSAKGYAGNQPSKGTRFKSGGGFYWSTSGGPVVSVSSGFSGFSFSVNLGTKGSSGYYVAAPNKKDYFKLYVKKTYKAEKLAFYGHPYNHQSGPKQFLYYGHRKSLYSQSASAKAQ